MDTKSFVKGIWSIKSIVLVASCFIPFLLVAEVGITFTLGGEGFTYSEASLFFEFDILAQASQTGTRIGTGAVFLRYNAEALGSWIYTNSNASVGKGVLVDDPWGMLYNLIVNDTAENVLAITFEYNTEPGYGNLLPGEPTQLVHVKMKLLNTDQLVMISLWPAMNDPLWPQYMANQQYYDDNETNYDPVLIGDGLHCTFEPEVLSIQLHAGWNLFSSSVEPFDKNMLSVLAGLISTNVFVKVQDESGNSIVQDVYGDWQNGIGDMAISEGYYINVSSDCILQISGMAVELPFSVLLYTGWNIISYPLSAPRSATEVLQPLMNAGLLVKAQDEAGNALTQDIYGGWDNGIGDFTAGEAYYINVAADCMLVYDE
jgi:hypothetical protein